MKIGQMPVGGRKARIAMAPTDRQIIDACNKEKNPRKAVQVWAIHSLVVNSKSVREATKISSRRLNTIKNCYRRFQKRGINGLPAGQDPAGPGYQSLKLSTNACDRTTASSAPAGPVQTPKRARGLHIRGQRAAAAREPWPLQSAQSHLCQQGPICRHAAVAGGCKRIGLRACKTPIFPCMRSPSDTAARLPQAP